jgi:hypothetical protein
MHVPDLFFIKHPDKILDPASVSRKAMRRMAISTHTRGHPKPFTARGIEDNKVLTSKSWLCIGHGREVLLLRRTRTSTVTRLREHDQAARKSARHNKVD